MFKVRPRVPAIAFAIAASFVLFTQFSAAQDSHSRFELFAEGGISTANQFSSFQTGIVSVQPLEFSSTAIKSSLRSTGRLFSGVRLWVDSKQAFEVSYSYSPSALVSRLTCVPACPEDSIQAVPLRANFFAGNYVHTLPSFGRWQPFLTAGAGGLLLEPQYRGIKHDPFTANLGGGFDHPLAPHWFLRTEYRDWIFDMPRYGSTPSGLVHNMVPSIGPVFRF